MTVKELYTILLGLPKKINIVKEDKHPWIGDYKDAPEWVLDSNIKSACLLINTDYPQVIIYI